MLRTPRLSLRAFRDEDVPALYEFMSQTEAMRYTYVAPTLEHCAARLRAYEEMRRTHGFAPWVVFNSGDSEPIGWGGLSVDPEAPQWGLEVGYAFNPAHWGSGYATELVQCSVAHAFSVLAVREVRAFAMPENAGSVRVLEKCGFHLVRYEPSLQRNHYLVTAPDET